MRVAAVGSLLLVALLAAGCDRPAGPPAAAGDTPARPAAETPLDLRAGGPAAVAGRVVERATGEGLAGVTVQLWGCDFEAYRRAVTDDRGRYEIIDLDGGRYRLYVGENRAGMSPAWHGDRQLCPDRDDECLAVAGGTAVDGADFALDPGTPVRGSVREADGRVVSFPATAGAVGVEVGVWTADRQWVGHWTVGGQAVDGTPLGVCRDGSFEVHLRPGRYYLQVKDSAGVHRAEYYHPDAERDADAFDQAEPVEVGDRPVVGLGFFLARGR